MADEKPKYYITVSGPHELGWIYLYHGEGETENEIMLVDEFGAGGWGAHSFPKTDVREIEPAEYRIMEIVLNEGVHRELELAIYNFIYKKYGIKEAE